MPHVFIDGQAGTTGLGIAQRLHGVPGIVLLALPEAHRKSPAARQDAMHAADLTILCLPDEAARESVSLADTDTRILDASSAHRVSPGWVYGFAELAPGQPAAIAQAGRVANPGCYATGAVALLRPLVDAGLIPADAALSINAVSGYSGGGNAMIAAHECDGGPAFALYGLGLAHKHLPEMVAHARLARTPIFVPSVAHLRQGMIVSIPLHLDAIKTTVEALRAALMAYYPADGQVHVVQDDAAHTLPAEALTGSDMMELRVMGHRDSAILIARLDNLGKGASGAAVQNVRLMLDVA